MLFIFRLILIAVLTYLIAMMAPWWSAILCAAIVAFFLPGNNFNAFLSGFMGVGLIWMVMAWKLDVETNSIMSQKMVELFPVDEVNMLIIASAIIGGLAGALGAFSGNSFRQMFVRKKEKSFYN
ncbi:hypothetical protein SAMN04488029_4014 [Reichenbachiella faecimaris]|uniref:Uncharacterized protein n=1 Tax=Reichenbachiella faecimaris TaxID=692418 RepID=A0A1W2GQT3_REIFA|nr:hypothetical protein [Reichenbachiella faecimaris]SMD39035.1 hypothetical protein SAMN04488029_4014 [Reichenbachiella faecimaris]